MTNFVQKAASSRETTSQEISYTASSVAATNAFGTETQQIRLVSNTACNYLITDTAAGTANQTSSPFLPANVDRIVTVQPGEFISAIRAKTDGGNTATSGILWITEMS